MALPNRGCVPKPWWHGGPAPGPLQENCGKRVCGPQPPTPNTTRTPWKARKMGWQRPPLGPPGTAISRAAGRELQGLAAACPSVSGQAPSGGAPVCSPDQQPALCSGGSSPAPSPGRAPGGSLALGGDSPRARGSSAGAGVHLCTSWRFSCRSRLCCSPLAAVSFSSSDTRFSRKMTSGGRQEGGGRVVTPHPLSWSTLLSALRGRRRWGPEVLGHHSARPSPGARTRVTKRPCVSSARSLAGSQTHTMGWKVSQPAQGARGGSAEWQMLKVPYRGWGRTWRGRTWGGERRRRRGGGGEGRRGEGGEEGGRGRGRSRGRRGNGGENRKGRRERKKRGGREGKAISHPHPHLSLKEMRCKRWRL